MSGGPYITPRALISGPRTKDAVAAQQAWAFLGPERAFTAIDVTTVQGAPVTALMTRPAYDNALVCASPLTGRAMDAALAALGTARADFAGLDLSTTRIMGIVNVTPDSFSDGGKFTDTDTAIAHGMKLVEEGADIVDVGGESTRPGAQPVAPDEEQRRVIPVVRALADKGLCVSIDTRHAATMGAALAAGARIVNDVTAFTDPDALKIVAPTKAAVILMHMQGDPRTMQKAPTYAWAPGDVFDALAGRLKACRDAGIAAERIAVDPGIGFGKTETHSAQILNHLALFHGLGCPVVVGASRKRLIATFSQCEPADARLPGSLAIALGAVEQGAQIVRVHDVKETRQALAVRRMVLST